MQKIMQWFAVMLSSGDGASFGRFASLLSLVFCLGWDTAYIVFVMAHFAAFKFTAGDLLAYSGALMAQGAFCTLFYGVNKLSGMGIFNGGSKGPQGQ
jgi:hypothetical protein